MFLQKLHMFFKQFCIHLKKSMEFLIILTYPEEAGLKCKLNDNQNEIFPGLFRCKKNRKSKNFSISLLISQKNGNLVIIFKP